MIDSSTLHAVTAESIHFTTRDELDAIRGELQPVQVVEIHAEISTEADLFESLAAALTFPEYFGRNWDAVDELLRDLGWLDISSGIVLVVGNAERLWTTNSHLAGLLVEVWLGAAEEWRIAEVPFHLVFEW